MNSGPMLPVSYFCLQCQLYRLGRPVTKQKPLMSNQGLHDAKDSYVLWDTGIYLKNSGLLNLCLLLSLWAKSNGTHDKATCQIQADENLQVSLALTSTASQTHVFTYISCVLDAVDVSAKETCKFSSAWISCMLEQLKCSEMQCTLQYWYTAV